MDKPSKMLRLGAGIDLCKDTNSILQRMCTGQGAEAAADSRANKSNRVWWKQFLQKLKCAWAKYASSVEVLEMQCHCIHFMQCSRESSVVNAEDTHRQK